MGLFGRSLHDLYGLTKRTLDVPADTAWMPKTILYPVDFFPMPDQTHQSLMEEFVTVFEQYLNIKRTEVNLAKKWEEDPPPSAAGQTLQQYIAKVGALMILFVCWLTS